MKKIFTLSLLASIISISAVSCKSHEKCPAYSKVEKSSKTKI